MNSITCRSPIDGRDHAGGEVHLLAVDAHGAAAHGDA